MNSKKRAFSRPRAKPPKKPPTKHEKVTPREAKMTPRSGPGGLQDDPNWGLRGGLLAGIWRLRGPLFEASSASCGALQGAGASAKAEAQAQAQGASAGGPEPRTAGSKADKPQGLGGPAGCAEHPNFPAIWEPSLEYILKPAASPLLLQRRPTFSGSAGVRVSAYNLFDFLFENMFK